MQSNESTTLSKRVPKLTERAKVSLEEQTLSLMKRKTDGKGGNTAPPKKARMRGNADGHSSEDDTTTPSRRSEPADNEGSDNNDSDIISSPFGRGASDVTETRTKKSQVTTSATCIDLTVKDELSEQ
jgi:hypothetical protein